MSAPSRPLAVLVGAACLCLAGSAPAQQQKPKAPALGTYSLPAGKNPPRAQYSSYEASQRQRLRRDTCMRDEDMVKQYCVKKCAKGYIVSSGASLPRVCRTEKPLPPGQLPEPYHRQTGIQPVPPPPSKPTPGA